MSFTVEAFVSEPKLSKLAMLKRSELVALASHYKLEVSSGMRKGDVWKLLSNFLIDQKLVSDEEIHEGRDSLEIRRLEWRERKRSKKHNSV